MPTLKRTGHELFVHGLARGLTQEAAYEEAGYVGGRGSASKVAARPEVKERLAELLGGMTPGVGVNLALVVDDLLRLAHKGEEKGSAAGLAAARTALLAAVELNKTVEKMAARRWSAQPPILRLTKEEGEAKYGPQVYAQLVHEAEEHARFAIVRARAELARQGG